MSNIILAIDSSMNCCSVAIYKNKYIYSLTEKCIKNHTTYILPMIQKILLQTTTIFKELNYIAFSRGPGNFTSIRITEGIANSLAISLNIPIIGISTLLIMAEQAWRKYKKEKIIVAMQAKQNEVYWAKYTRNKQSIWMGEETESVLKKRLIEDKINNLEGNWTLAGDVWKQMNFKQFSNINQTEIIFPNSKDIIPFILLKIKNKKSFHYLKNKINYLYDNF